MTDPTQPSRVKQRPLPAYVRGTDTEIVGTLERVPASKSIDADSWAPGPDGKVAFRYDRTAAEIFWDDMRTVMRGGRRVFLDESGGEYQEDEIELRPEGDEQGEANDGDCAAQRERPAG